MTLSAEITCAFGRNQVPVCSDFCKGIDIFELVPPEASLDPDQELTLFHPAEMELSETTKHILISLADAPRSGRPIKAAK